MWGAVKVLHTASRPLEDLTIVVHHTADAGTETALTVVTGISGCPFKVVEHAQVVADLVSQDLTNKMFLILAGDLNLKQSLT